MHRRLEEQPLILQAGYPLSLPQFIAPCCTVSLALPLTALYSPRTLCWPRCHAPRALSLCRQLYADAAGNAMVGTSIPNITSTLLTAITALLADPQVRLETETGDQLWTQRHIQNELRYVHEQGTVHP